MGFSYPVQSFDFGIHTVKLVLIFGCFAYFIRFLKRFLRAPCSRCFASSDEQTRYLPQNVDLRRLSSTCSDLCKYSILQNSGTVLHMEIAALRIRSDGFERGIQSFLNLACNLVSNTVLHLKGRVVCKPRSIGVVSDLALNLTGLYCRLSFAPGMFDSMKSQSTMSANMTGCVFT